MHNHYYNQQPEVGQLSYVQDPDLPPPVLGSRDVDGNRVSDDDRDDVREARDRYEEALAAAEDSDASSSDMEELEEARQEYIEEYEETYGGDEYDD